MNTSFGPSIYLIIFLATWPKQQYDRTLIYDINVHASIPMLVNTLKQGQNGHHFTDDTCKRIFLNENVRISINISSNCVLYGPIDSIGSVNDLAPVRRQAIIWTNDGSITDAYSRHFF